MASPAPNALPLQCRIEAQPEYQLGKPILITGTLHNSGPSAVWILSWNTFLEAKWQNCLSVTHDDSPVPFVGLTALRGNPPQEAYVRIRPGESRSAQIDISERYAITEPGDYQAAFRLPISGAVEVSPNERPLDETQYLPNVIESAVIRFRLNGDRLARADNVLPSQLSFEAAKTEILLPAEPMTPTFKGSMTPGEKENYLHAHRWAYKAICAALETARKAVDSSQYSKWMEDLHQPWGRKGGWETRLKIVIDTLSGMAQWMATTSIVYEKVDGSNPNCGSGVYSRQAFTSSKSKGAISLCPGRVGAFDDDWFRFRYGRSAQWCRALLVVHEISHAVAGTADHYYSFFECEYLSTYTPWWAVENAQSYALLAMACSLDPPSGVRPDNGVFTYRDFPGALHTSHPPAAAAVSDGVVIAAFREPVSEGGRLRYRMLHLNGDREDWKNAQLLYPAGRSDLQPSAAPAVAVAMDLNWLGSMGDKIYCVYVDDSFRLWSVDADQRDAIRKGDWANLPWQGPELISANANRAMGAALFHYVGGLSTGLYCVYVDNSTEASSGTLRGAVKLFHPAGGLSPWQPLEVNRFTRSAPALAIFQGQLKLAFIDGGTLRPVVLTYVPWTGGLLPQTGVWRQDPSAPPFLTDSISLGRWNTAGGDKLIALGRSIQDGHVRYSVSTNGTAWQPEVRMQTFTSLSGPALVSSGSSLYAFSQRGDQVIESIVAV